MPKVTNEKREQMVKPRANHPHMPVYVIAQRAGVSRSTASKIMKEALQASSRQPASAKGE